MIDLHCISLARIVEVCTMCNILKVVCMFNILGISDTRAWLMRRPGQCRDSGGGPHRRAVHELEGVLVVLVAVIPPAQHEHGFYRERKQNPPFVRPRHANHVVGATITSPPPSSTSSTIIDVILQK